MGLEIERKFLVDTAKLLPVIAREPPYRWKIKQGYFSVEPPVARTRHVVDDKGNESGYVTAKGEGLLSKEEVEEKISPDKARQFYNMCKITLEKVRLFIHSDGHHWEVDVFEGKLDGFIMAEIELRTEEEEFVRPSWVTKEVTNDKHYSNLNLARYGIPKDE